MSKIENAENVSLFALNANQPLAQAVADQVGIPLSKCTISHFADGEISVTIDESVRGREVYVIQSISEPVNTNLMELLIMVDALRRASAKKINVVVPYYGYARQDRKAGGQPADDGSNRPDDRRRPSRPAGTRVLRHPGGPLAGRPNPG